MAENKRPAQNFESFLKESISSAELSIDTEKLNKILNEDTSSDDIETGDEEKNDEYSYNFESSDAVSENSLNKPFLKQQKLEKKRVDKEFPKSNIEAQPFVSDQEKVDVVANNLLNSSEEGNKNDNKEILSENKLGGLGDKFISDDDDVSNVDSKKDEVDTDISLKNQIDEQIVNNDKVEKENDRMNEFMLNNSNKNSAFNEEKNIFEIDNTDENSKKLNGKFTDNHNSRDISFHESTDIENQNNGSIFSKNLNNNGTNSVGTDKEDGMTIKDINTINKLSDTAVDQLILDPPVIKPLEVPTKDDNLLENTTKTTPIQKLRTPTEIKVSSPYIYPSYKNTPLKSPHTPLYSTFPPTSSSHPSSSSTNRSNPLPLSNFHESAVNDNNSLRYSTSSSYCKETAERLKALDGLKRELNGGGRKEQREDNEKNNEMKLKIENLEREVRSQDVILRGYQVEAERMYKELKVAKVVTGDEPSRSGIGVDLLLEENASLKGQVIKLKKQLSTKEKLYSEIESMASSRTMTESPRKKDSPRKVNHLIDNDKTMKKVNAKQSTVTKVKTSLVLDKTYSNATGNKASKPRRSIGLKKVAEKSTDKSNKSQKKDINTVDMTEVERLRRDVEISKEEMKKKDEDFDARLSMYQTDFQVLKDKYHDHLKQLEEELEFYRQKTFMKKVEEKASGGNNKDETELDKDNGKKDKKKNEEDGRNTEKIDKPEKVSDLESIINSLKLQLSEKRLQEKVDEENEVRKLRIEISKLKGENVRFSECLKEKNAEIEKITDEKLEIQKKLVSVEQQHHTDSQRFKNIFTSAQMADKARITSQDNLIKNLKEELAEMVVREGLLDDLKMEVDDLKEKLKTSRQETFEARSLQSPSSKILQRLQGQLEEMEERLRQREEQLQLLSGRSAFSYESEVIKKMKQRHAEELDLWKALVAEKSKDIDHFRDQLDQLLQVLKAAKILSSQQF